jgi:putative transcriptional regulator
MASRAANILQGAREALSIAKGEADLATFKVHVPADVDVRSVSRPV